ncbi:MAG: GNAT family N-acetyltransferase [Gammaproteobacteria bacterium]
MLNYRLAKMDEVALIEALIRKSALALQSDDYSRAQIEGALGTVFGVDTQLIKDETYYAVDLEGQLVACGGWSRRQTLFGADAAKTQADPLLDPEIDAARIRAFFVHPEFARRGIGNELIRLSETAAAELGFKRMELVATLSGERLYASVGYKPLKHYQLDLVNDETMPVVSMGRAL